MMGDDRSKELLARWLAGDQSAADDLFGRYTVRLVAMVRRRLSARMARRIDAEDIVQSAYLGLCAAARKDGAACYRRADPGRVLAAIALHKLQREVEHHTAARRSVDREEVCCDPDREGIATAMARAPGPSEVASASEELEVVLKGLSASHRQMVELRLQGHPIEAIARASDRSERMVRKVLGRVGDRLSRRWGRPPGASGGRP